MSDYTASNIAGILAAVTAQMSGAGAQVENELGGAANAASGAGGSIVWVPHPDMDATYEPPTMQPLDGEVILYVLQPYIVTITGEDVGAADALHDALLVALNTLFGIFGQTPIKRRPVGDGVSASGFAYSLTLRLRLPIYRYFYGRAPIETTEVQGVVQTLAPSTDPDADPGQTTEMTHQ